MYVKTKDGNRFVNITPNNFDSLSIDMKGNVICIISGRVTNLGIYSHLDEGIKKNFIDAFFAIIHRDIKTENIFHMPESNEAMVAKILEWAKDLDANPDKSNAADTDTEPAGPEESEPVEEAKSESESDVKDEEMAEAEKIIEKNIAEREENSNNGKQEEGT